MRRYGVQRKGEDQQSLRVEKEFQLGWLCSVSPVVFLLNLLLKYLQNGNGLVSALCLTLKCSQLNRGHSEGMLCNFAVGLDLVTSLKIHTPLRHRPSWPGAPSPKLVSQSVRLLEAGSWSNDFRVTTA